tara:strand:+ start:104 stop:310 length:207 start_codon:yes stop_codon:yes gene_type:complete
MYIILNEVKEVIGLTGSENIVNITDSEIVEIDIVPDNLVGNYSYIDGEFIEVVKEEIVKEEIVGNKGI